MRITPLGELIRDYELVSTADLFACTVIADYLRFPRADELVFVVSDVCVLNMLGEPDICNLKFIGEYPGEPLYTICSRSDSGVFWRTIAVIKYRMFVVQAWTQTQVIRRLRLYWLRSFFRVYNITPSYLDIEACMQGSVEARQIVAIHQARQALSIKISHPCKYYHSSSTLSCAVHPSHKEQGFCNEQCPDFAEK